MTKAISETYSLFYLPNQGRFIKFSAPSTAYIYYKSFRINLLTGVREEILIDQFLNCLEEQQLCSDYDKAKVYHLFYELGYIIENLQELAKENIPLAIELEYEESTFENIHGRATNFEGLEVLQYPSFKDYSKKFSEGRDKLLDGECYQFNLTSPFYFQFKETTSPESFINKAWSEAGKPSAFAHCTYLAEPNKMLFSNSPECLFQFKSEPRPTIYSMPIKGTVKVSEDSQRKQAWETLKSCPKNEAELFMITDL
ncbi:MAG: chorismate-binding protein, partial [Bacteriovoracaceae bacterium]|nr:chorismate-binding protein [Bacteriovoracaceae bacterium]